MQNPLWQAHGMLPSTGGAVPTLHGARARIVVPMGSSGQSKQAAWQRSLKEHKEASCRVVFEQRDSERSKTGKLSFANQYSVS